MVDDRVPTGQTLTDSAAPFASLFDTTGIFQDFWPSANCFLSPQFAAGNTYGEYPK